MQTKKGKQVALERNSKNQVFYLLFTKFFHIIREEYERKIKNLIDLFFLAKSKMNFENSSQNNFDSFKLFNEDLPCNFKKAFESKPDHNRFLFAFENEIEGKHGLGEVLNKEDEILLGQMDSHWKKEENEDFS